MSLSPEDIDGHAELNALQDNIQRKGQNAYYYAHTKSNSSDPTILAYDSTPQKLSSAPSSSTDIKSGSYVRPIKKYSWADFKKTVRIYIDLPGISDLPDDNITLSFENNEKFLKAKFTGLGQPAEDCELNLPKLHEKITKATFKRKDGDRLVITLYKAEEITWYELQMK